MGGGEGEMWREEGKWGEGGRKKMEWGRGNSVEDPDTDNRTAVFSFTIPALLTETKISVKVL
jgi:hypothetical protein